MGSFTYMAGGAGTELLPRRTPMDTKNDVAAELRGKGLNVIAAALEGGTSNHVCGVVVPGREEAWALSFETDVVELVKRRLAGAI